MADVDTALWAGHVAGYSFALVVGHFCVAGIVNTLWATTGWRSDADVDVRATPHLPRIVGLVERSLYVAALEIGQAAFIGIWLALKVAGQWKRWGEGLTVDDRTISGRTFYNIFLIGNGLSVGYALVGAQIVSLTSEGRWLLALALPLVLVISTGLLWLVVRHYHKRLGY